LPARICRPPEEPFYTIDQTAKHPAIELAVHFNVESTNLAGDRTLIPPPCPALLTTAKRRNVTATVDVSSAVGTQRTKLLEAIASVLQRISVCIDTIDVANIGQLASDERQQSL
jgi:hypothetical protein